MSVRRKRINLQPEDLSRWTAHEGDFLAVAVHKPKDARGWSLTVWGPDDFGCALDGLDCETAYALFKKIDSGIAFAQLKAMGFKQVG